MVDVDPGATAKPSLTDLVARAVESAAHKVRPHEHAAKDARLTEWLEGFEQTHAPLIEQFVAAARDDPNTPASVRTLLDTLANPAHKFDASLIGVALVALVYPFIQAAILPAVTDTEYGAWTILPHLKLPPAELALGVVKHTVDPGDARGEAQAQGLNGTRFQTLVDNTGNPPGPGELTDLLNRGVIDYATWVHGILQGRTRDEWTGPLFDGRLRPPSAGEAIVGALKGHLDKNTAASLVEQNGIDPANFEWMRASAGRPPGTEQMLHLWNRGVATEAQVDASIRQSDINDDYLELVKELRHYFPPPRSIVPMVRAGAITETQARELLGFYGVGEPWASAFIAEAHTTRTQSLRDLGASQVLRAYEEQLIDQPTATVRLTHLRYVPADITLMLELTDNARHERFRNSAIARVHTRYVMHKMTHSQATTALATLTMPAPAITDLLTLWTHERDANITTLTLSQCQRALRDEMFTLDEFVGRAVALGYVGFDIKVVAVEAWPPGKIDPNMLDAINALKV